MRRTSLIVGVLLVALPAVAQETPQASPEEIIAQFYIETGQLRSALGQSQVQGIALRKQVEQLKAELAKAKTSPASPQPEEGK